MVSVSEVLCNLTRSNRLGVLVVWVSRRDVADNDVRSLGGRAAGAGVFFADTAVKDGDVIATDDACVDTDLIDGTVEGLCAGNRAVTDLKGSGVADGTCGKCVAERSSRHIGTVNIDADTRSETGTVVAETDVVPGTRRERDAGSDAHIVARAEIVDDPDLRNTLVEREEVTRTGTARVINLVEDRLVAAECRSVHPGRTGEGIGGAELQTRGVAYRHNVIDAVEGKGAAVSKVDGRGIGRVGRAARRARVVE